MWIAWNLWRDAPRPMPVVAPGAAPRGAWSALRLGTLSMLANPKPAIFFGAVFVGLVPAAATLEDKAIVLLNILWIEAAWYVVVARVFSLPRSRAAYARIKTAADRTFGGALAALGIGVAAT